MITIKLMILNIIDIDTLINYKMTLCTNSDKMIPPRINSLMMIKFNWTTSKIIEPKRRNTWLIKFMVIILSHYWFQFVAKIWWKMIYHVLKYIEYGSKMICILMKILFYDNQLEVKRRSILWKEIVSKLFWWICKLTFIIFIGCK